MFFFYVFTAGEHLARILEKKVKLLPRSLHGSLAVGHCQPAGRDIVQPLGMVMEDMSKDMGSEY